jgi:hypothetical protein
MDFMPTMTTIGVDHSYYSVEEFKTRDWMLHSINNNNYQPSEVFQIESLSRKRKGDELTTELNTLSISLGIEADFLVQENQKRKHIKTLELPPTETTTEAPTPVNTPRSYSRTVEIRFGLKQDTFRARIICKVCHFEMYVILM